MSGDGRHDWNVDLELEKPNHTFTINARDPDFGEHIDVYEYKFEGYDLWARTIESKCNYPDHTEYKIKNGKVLEQEYRDRQGQGSGLFSSPEEVEERVQKLYADLEWNNFNHPVVKYFIFFRHEDLFDDATAKNHLQSEYDRITRGYKRLEERVYSLGCSIGKSEYSQENTIKFGEETPPENRAEAQEILYNNGFQRFDISYGEFIQYTQLIEDLKRYISKL